MKPALLRELRQQLTGSVTTAEDVLDYFATDGSIFRMQPEVVVYPHDATDVQRVVQLAAAKAGGDDRFTVSGRGKGTDQAGGALGDGLMVVFPAQMDNLVKLHKDSVTVQPGLVYGALQKILHSHGRFLPPYPSSIEFSTIGGAIANNACGEKTVKYGATRDFVKSLKVVLADGKLVETRRLTPRELRRKQGQDDLEGEIYRQVDHLIEDNRSWISQSVPHTSKNAAGYALWRVKGPGGSFDLSQLIVGSQGTLGLVTEITLKTLPYNPRTTLVVGYFSDLEKAGQAVLKLKPLEPSALEVVDYYLLDFLRLNQPATIEGLVPDELPKIVLLAEFDNASYVRQNWLGRRAQHTLIKLADHVRLATKPAEQQALWKIRRSAAAVIWQGQGKKKALPIIEDGVVPVAKLPQFLDQLYKMLRRYKLDIAVWGHAGDGHLHLQPWLDLSKEKDRATVFKLADDFYDMVMKLGGSTCGEHNDGLMRAPYLPKLYGQKVYDLFVEVKNICDPQGIFNPRIKLGVKQSDLKGLVRHEYSMKHLYDHLPHT